MAFELNEDEASLARHIEDALPCDLGIDRKDLAVIRAAALQRFFLALPVRFPGESATRVVRLSSAGVRVRRAEIEGDLDLQDLSASEGGPLAPLRLENCVMRGEIHLSRSRFRHLSLSGSRISYLCGEHLIVDGPVDLSRLRSSEEAVKRGANGQGLCWVHLPGLRTGGTLDIGDARLVAPQARKNPDRPRYALSLPNAVIGGAFRMLPRGSALGGISLVGATIQGDLRCDGARLTAVEGLALDAQTTEIRGYVNLAPESAFRFQARGGVSFIGSSIGGALVASGAQLNAFERECVFTALNAKIDGPLEMAEQGEHRFEANGPIEMEGVHIDGELDFRGAKLDADGFALWAPNAIINGRARLSGGPLHRFDAKGVVDLTRAKIGGDFSIAGAALQSDDTALQLVDAEIAGAAWLFRMTVQGLINLVGVQISRELNLNQSELVGRQGRAVVAFDAKIGADFNMYEAKAAGEINLVDAEIKDSVNVVDTEFDEQEDRIGLVAAGVAIGGKLHLDGLTFHPAQWPGKFALDLEGGKVSGPFEASRIRAAPGPEGGDAIVDLRGLRVEELNDGGGEAWGERIAMRLDGFSYDRLQERRNGRSPIWLRRRRWLGLQYRGATPDADEYSPQPYDRLIQVLRSTGFFDDAQKIASLKLRTERRLRRDLLWPFAWAFEKLFDYGLSPTRAVFSLVGFIALGAVAVFIAQLNPGWPGRPPGPPILVVDTNAVSSVVVIDPRTAEVSPAVLRAEGRDAMVGEVACGRQIEPLLYAIDVFVPGIDLQQERRCTVSSRKGALGWRIAKAVYAVLGWIVTSLTVLTVSGLLRRHAEA